MLTAVWTGAGSLLLLQLGCPQLPRTGNYRSACLLQPWQQLGKKCWRLLSPMKGAIQQPRDCRRTKLAGQRQWAAAGRDAC